MDRYARLLRTLAAGLLLLAAGSAARAGDGADVLILNSYHRGFSWSDAEEAGVGERLREVFPDIELRVEYLDSKRFPGEGHQRAMKKFLAGKYARGTPALVVALDDPAMELLTRYREELFPAVPVVFAGISDHRRYTEGGRGRITGVVELQDVAGTLETAIGLHPDARTVLVVCDDTTSGRSARRDVSALLPRFAGRADIRFLPPGTFDEARGAIRALPGNSLALIHSFTSDSSGKALSTRESTRLVVSAAEIPVYTVHKNRLGDGVVGGFLLDGETHGRRAADLALRILSGVDAADIPVEEISSSRPMFDYAQLSRFGIPLEKLPPGSVLIHKEPSVFETHRKFAAGAVAATSFLALLSALLVVAVLRLKRTEEALRLTQHCVDRSPIAFHLIAEDGRIGKFNDSFRDALGYAPGELASMAMSDVDPSFDPRSTPGRGGAERAGDSGTYESAYRRKDGSTFPVEVAVSRLRFKDRDVRVCFSKDVSERKAAERERFRLKERLFQSQKMETVGMLAGGVAHDFNNLLTPILGYSELMMLGLPAGHPDRKKLEQIHHAADLARVLTMRLLAFGRKQMLRLDVVDVGAIVRDLATVLRRTIREDIRIETCVGKEAGPARADKGQIEQALLNLAVNAQDAMPGGGTLTIETGNVELDASYASSHPEVLPGPYVVLSVSDTGTGMDAETRAHIFEPFYTTKETGKGTGLGLATVYGIVKQHGGAVTVYSEPGRGSVFKMYLPRVPAETRVGEGVPEGPGLAERGTGTVLVAEDNETVRTLACRMLEDLGYRVLSGGDAASCLALSRRHPERIDLLLTDVIMPGKNGKELYEELKRERPGMKVLFMSGYSANVIGHHGVLDEGVHLLQKPFSRVDLSVRVRQALGMQTNPDDNHERM